MYRTFYTWREVRDVADELPVLCEAQADDLVWESDNERVWISRVNEYPHTYNINVEGNDGSGWHDVTDEYDADDVMCLLEHYGTDR